MGITSDQDKRSGDSTEAGAEVVRHIPLLLSRTTEVRDPSGDQETFKASPHLEGIPGSGGDSSLQTGGAAQMKCPICSGEMVGLFTFPDLPVNPLQSADLTFMFCEGCSHGALQNQVDAPGELVSAQSKSAMACLAVFADFVHIHSAGAPTVIDIGGNDSSLLKFFFGENKVCIDPMVGESIEEADLSKYRFPKKLILSSHTIEHLKDPRVMISKVAAIMRDQDYLALQFPCLELLIEDCRLDQIHHQHLHYFTAHSICTLLNQYGLGVVDMKKNPDHWGTMMLICKRGQGLVFGKTVDWLNILNARVTFSLEMMACDMRLKKKPFVAYGYGPMYRILGYHLPSLKDAEYIVDNDPKKGRSGSLADKDVFISAFSSKTTARELVTSALERGARNVIVPLLTV